MRDATETVRRALVPVVNSMPDEAIEGRTWSTEELTTEFDVIGFMAPFVGVRRKADGVEGIMTFRHSPRVYFGFTPA